MHACVVVYFHVNVTVAATAAAATAAAGLLQYVLSGLIARTMPAFESTDLPPVHMCNVYVPAMCMGDFPSYRHFDPSHSTLMSEFQRCECMRRID